MGNALGKPLPHRCAQAGRGLLQQRRATGKGGKIVGLRAKGHMGDTSQPVQNADAAQGKMLRLPNGPGNRELQHHVRAAFQSHAGPLRRGKQRTLPALGKAAGHHAQHPIGLRALPRLLQMISMPQVKGIIFRDDAHCAHERTPPCLEDGLLYHARPIGYKGGKSQEIGGNGTLQTLER